ncbi:TlyA family RNA methyltransferase [Candidatus Sororendozoicomonas aggregata]|uniref:TlyA family RNA methyltransferase n=1 Tax=Candidatus Sororendozoicomonas aggregata TaxID=3073239 RepID=UPI002ED15A72
MMERIDRLLVEKGCAVSRTQAQRLLSEGRVNVKVGGRWETPAKPSQKYPYTVDIETSRGETDRYVSRGGLKLAGALETTGLCLDGMTVLDVGQSTGGFTDCALQAGAASVVGVEVGHDQLVMPLRQDSRVVCYEGMNARDLPHEQLLNHANGPGFDLAVMDVSFISQTKILPSLVPLIKSGGHLITLVKPQFEVGQAGLGKGGIVRDKRLYLKVKVSVIDFCRSQGLLVSAWFDSPIQGGDGNKEFFIHAKKR